MPNLDTSSDCTPVTRGDLKNLEEAMALLVYVTWGIALGVALLIGASAIAYLMLLMR